MKIVGLDLSLTSTGVATIETGDGHEHCTVERITSKGSKDATLYQRQARLHNLRLDICLRAGMADLVIVEGPSFGQARQGGQHDRAGLWWNVVDWLINNAEADGWGVPVAEVPPATRSRYATGKGNAAKDAVLAAVVRRYPQVEVTGNDEADALVLAAMGARHLGHPIEDSLPQTHIAALDAVRWPEPPAVDGAA
jgi:crossover junction endodeoxyribonuclease RuvC